MAPPPEYDKEPKAPDKSTTNISTEDSKLLHNLLNDQLTNSDHKPTNSVAAVEVENNKHVETLDDGQLRALLDEAITYKCPKDREGKSSLFKELLEEVEQDEQACEAAARTLSGGRGARRGGRTRNALPHSNSLQDLVAALAAEPAPRRHHVRHAPAPAPSTVAARALHGGSLPSGVDTSSLLSEEPARGAGYLATVRCVNPPPLAERRVSASDANTPAEMELLNRRSKPMFPMTYTARATLEIGSGSVCSGRAVTTTTASNQVRTPATRHSPHRRKPAVNLNQLKLMNALRPKKLIDGNSGTQHSLDTKREAFDEDKNKPPGLITRGLLLNNKEDVLCQHSLQNVNSYNKNYLRNDNHVDDSQMWADNVDNWYKTLSLYSDPCLDPSIQKESAQIFSKDINIDSGKESKNYLNIQEHINHPSIPAIDKRANYLPDFNKIDRNFERKKNNIYCIADPNMCENFLVKEELHRVAENIERDDEDFDISLRKNYRNRVGKNLVVPTLSEYNPRNVRCMTIGYTSSPAPTSSCFTYTHNECIVQEVNEKKNKIAEMLPKNELEPMCLFDEAKKNYKAVVEDMNETVSNTFFHSSLECNDTEDSSKEPVDNILCRTNSFVDKNQTHSNDIELADMSSYHLQKNFEDSFPQYVSMQKGLLDCIGSSYSKNNEDNAVVTTRKYKNEDICQTLNLSEHVAGATNDLTIPSTAKENTKSDFSEENKTIVCANKTLDNDDTAKIQPTTLTKVPNAYILLTLPKSLLSQQNSDVLPPVQFVEIENNNNIPLVSESNTKTNTIKKKKEKMPLENPVSMDKKKNALDKNVLKVLLFESLFKNKVSENLLGNLEVSAITDKEVDSAISFSCITTPEVVASCNTTSSTAQSTVAVDPKPRSVISSSYNGLPLTRPNYGSTGSSATDDYKKSLDENGNSVQGFSSPLSGSSQHKKPRRKKSSKNETVIDCQQIDGYQGDKDVNELLRFIESNADHGRGAKLGRIKHKDDSDDKSGKKRSAERRKDKESKMKRASSLEELSRTKIEDLTDVAEAPMRSDKKERRDAAAKAERRSWGEDTLLFADAPEPAPELTDFQTVTKKRKPRRRTDEHEREPPRRARPPSPRARRESAPPSDRSNDSNDDMDSVHSLPAAPPPAPPAAPAPQASYADIARTRHNIPDLIESCNFYAEGEAPRRAAAAPGDADGYPALDARPGAARRPRDKAAAPRRKERAAPPADGPAPDCVAPDVVADRRPPVILLDSAAQPRDMDGVTFGFDINEQLLSGGARRLRCDLLRDAPEGGGTAPERGAAEGGAAPDGEAVSDGGAAPDGGAVPGGVAVRAGCAALRYVPPEPPLDTQHLLQIVDYVGAAWEDAVRCGAGKVRYFSD